MEKAWLSAGYSRALDGFDYKAGFGISSKLNSLQIYTLQVYSYKSAYIN